MTDAPVKTDVAIIGAGPVGLFAIFECGMLDMHCHVIDALDAPGGQCAALYPEKPIYDIPGFPRILASDLVERLQEQAAPFAPVYHLGQQVIRLDRQTAGGWLLTTSAGTSISTAAIIIAAGVGAFGPNRPPLAGIRDYEGLPAGSGVQYLVRRREDYRGRKVVIAGGGDSAVDWALSLADVAASIAVVHRRDKFRAAPQSVQQLRALAQAGRIELVVPYQLHAIEGDGTGLKGVIVRDLDGGERRLAADVLLPFYGLTQDLGPIAAWGLNLDRNHIAVDPASFSAGPDGIFAAGDIASYPGKLKLILTGFAEAAAAAHAAYAIVHPGEALHFEYSTTRGVPHPA
ncbi:MAG: NAD(P)/FAD-dependent oxidoreductase [Defluviicoccus sp.]|nr:NAD(P)/FAD-dependent oxidoreductase [Defluviicoccus sp.]MDG4609519.1 NAD(P)/FAD-dependent oxidoreductase [Defluviicoccus sp.]